MNLMEHAENELRIAGLLDTEDEMQEEMNNHILKMVKEFSEEGHSGFSASYALGILKRLLNFEPIVPLTGEDDEWEKVDGETYQNKRMTSIFKRGKNGQAYRIDGVVFRDQNGATFGCEYSRTPVSFPYSPKEPMVVDIYCEREE